MAIILNSDHVVHSLSVNLLAILAHCPSSILKKAKDQRDLKKLICSDQLANDCILLDNEIKIEKDDARVSQFSHAIFNFVECLAELVRYHHKYHQRDNDIKCTVLPAGSFPQNVKIETLDEFDFVFVLESESKSPNIDEWVELLLFGDTHSLAKVIGRLLQKCINKNGFVETNLLQKDHCVNLIISRICPYKHKHSLSVDIAISVKTSTKLQDIFRKVNFPLIGTRFENSIDRNVYWNSELNGNIPGGRIDTNIFDKQLFDPKLDISYEYLPKPTKLIKRAEILMQISWEKAGAIYKNPQELSTLQLTKNKSMIQSILKSAEHWSETTEYRILLVKLSFQEFWLLASLNYIENIK